MNRSYKSGFGLLEIVIVSSIIAVVSIGFFGVLQSYIKMTNTSGQYAQASLLVEEGAEAINMMRDISWSANIGNLSIGTPYYLYWDGSQYIATTTVTTIGNSFYRIIKFSSVSRDSDDNIVSSGTVDTNTRKVTVSVSPANASASALLNVDFLIHNIYDN